jgi:hypothetical protein
MTYKWFCVVVILTIAHKIRVSDETVVEQDPNPTGPCPQGDECKQDSQICFNKQCYPLRNFRETCIIEQQCQISDAQCISGVCLCPEGFELQDSNCKESLEHELKRKQAEEDKKKRKNAHDNKLLVWRIIGITGGVILLVAVLIFRHRIRKNKTRMNIQDRRKSVLNQSRSLSVSLPMSAMGPKRKFSEYYTERF